MVGQGAAGFGEDFVVGDNGSAVSSRDLCQGIKSEHRGPAVAGGPAVLVFRAQRMPCVDDEIHSSMGCDSEDWVVIGGLAERVDRKNGPGAGGDCGLDSFRIEIVGMRIDSGEPYGKGLASKPVARGGKDERSSSDFIGFGNAQSAAQ